MKKYIIGCLLIGMIIGCSKKEDAVTIKDYKNGLFTSEVNNKTYSIDKFYTGNALMPLGYYRISETTGGVSYTSTIVIIKAKIETNIELYINYRSSMRANNPNEVEVVSTTPSTSFLKVNSITTFATKVIIRHNKGDYNTGSYEMYNGTTLLCKGQFSSD